MAFKVTFGPGATDRTAYVKYNPAPTITKKQNERSQATLTLKPGFVPAKYDPVVMYDVDGVTAVFGGAVLQRTTEGIETGAVLYDTQVLCVDGLIYTDWCFWTKTYAAPVTLLQVLTDLVADKLGAYGITVDASQDAGDTFQPFTVPGTKVSDFLRSLGTACVPPRIIRMSPLLALRMLVPGTEAAPVAISNATPNCTSFEWTDSSFTPANYVTLLCGPTGTDTPTQSWTVGAPSTWEVDIQCLVGGWNAGVVVENGSVSRTLGAPGSGAYYNFDPSVGKGTISVGAGVKAAAGTVLTFVYTAIYPFTVFATSGATPRIEAQYTDATQMLLAPAQAEVNGMLAELNQNPREATIITYTNGFKPSQSLAATLSSRGVSAATFSIAQVEAEFTEYKQSGVRLWRYTLSATETTVYQGSYLDQMRKIIGGGSGSTAIVGGGGGGGGSTVLSFRLGGSRNQSLPVGTTATPVIDWMPFACNTTVSAKARVTVRARTAGVAVTPIITKQTGPTTWVTHQAGSPYTGTAEAEQFIYATLAVGEVYRLEYVTDTVGASAYAIGQLENA